MPQTGNVQSKRVFVVLGLVVFALGLQAGYAQMGSGRLSQPIPAGAKMMKCSGRPIPRLDDITTKAGITFTHVSSEFAKYIPESMSGGVILLDYDRDGWLDIFFTNAPTVEMALKGQTVRGALYHNNHDGTFTDVTASAGLTAPCFGMGGAVGDYNNDGWPDLYLTCLGGNVLYRNNGDGTFTDVGEQAGVRDGRWSTGAAFGDYDGDGFLDLVVSNYVDFKLTDLPKFGSEANCKYRGIDIQCGPRGLKGAGDSLFHNRGDGTFENVSRAAGVEDAPGYYGLGVIWGHFCSKGGLDIYMANDSTPKYLYKNEGNGKFTDVGLESGTAVNEDGSEQASMGIAVGDYDHSGRQSFYVTNFEQEYDDLFRNDGMWNFSDVSFASGAAVPSIPWVKWGTAFADLDNDGWLDLITATGHITSLVDQLPTGAGYREPMLLQMNQKDGTFCDAGDQAGPAIQQKRVSRGLAVGDLFNDGNLDVVVENLEGAPVILRNGGVPGSHWVSFELAGTRSNRLAIGARVKLSAGGVTQTEEIHSGSSYLSQNDLRVHFGLGSATKIDRVEIIWPSGATETLTDLKADQYYAVLEGSGVVPAEQILPKSLQKTARFQKENKTGN